MDNKRYDHVNVFEESLDGFSYFSYTMPSNLTLIYLIETTDEDVVMSVNFARESIDNEWEFQSMRHVPANYKSNLMSTIECIISDNSALYYSIDVSYGDKKIPYDRDRSGIPPNLLSKLRMEIRIRGY